MSPEKTVEKFNEMFPIFARVNWRAKVEDEFVEYTVKQPAQVINGKPVAWLYSVNEMCSIEPELVKYD